jgi:hypothetical protein
VQQDQEHKKAKQQERLLDIEQAKAKLDEEAIDLNTAQTALAEESAATALELAKAELQAQAGQEENTHRSKL